MEWLQEKRFFIFTPFPLSSGENYKTTLNVPREAEMRSGGRDFTNLPLLQSSKPEMLRMSRSEKKERGWKVRKKWEEKE